jgi:hypothetical protein
MVNACIPERPGRERTSPHATCELGVIAWLKSFFQQVISAYEFGRISLSGTLGNY